MNSKAEKPEQGYHSKKLQSVAHELSKIDKLTEIDSQKKELDSIRPIDPEIESKVMQKIRIDWNFHSNAIEGNSLTLGETKMFLMHGLTAKGKPFKDYLDIQGHDEVLAYLESLIKNETPLTEAIIRKLHEILLVEPYSSKTQTYDGKIINKTIQIGTYKTTPNHVITKTGKIHHYASPAETPERMEDLMNWYRSEKEDGKIHPLILAALFHHEFTSIHPFDDGNGRMARILSNLILMQAGYLPVIISHKRKDLYLYALASADEGEYTELVEFFCDEEASMLELMNRAGRGEDISELGDFDKRLTLLRQKIKSENSENNVEATKAEKKRIMQELIKPVFKPVLPRAIKIGEMFTNYRFIANFKGEHSKLFMANNQSENIFNSLFGNADVPDFWEVVVSFDFKGFETSPRISLYYIITFTFSHKKFGVKSRKKHWEFDYGHKFSSEEIEEIAKTTLEELYVELESKVKKT